jgi:hypothetical protein
MNHYILSDIHEDYDALQKAISEISRDKSPHAIYSLGDNVGFSKHYPQQHKRNADGSINLLISYRVTAVLGNHDLHFLEKKPRLSLFIPPVEWEALQEDRKIEDGYFWPYPDELPTALGNDNMAFLKSRQEYAIYRDLLFSHFLFPDPNGCLVLKKGLPEKLLPVHFIFMEVNKIKVSFVGHLHIKQPIVISSKMEKTVLQEGESIFLDTTDDSYTIFCPALHTYRSPRSKFISYDDDSSMVRLHSIPVG